MGSTAGLEALEKRKCTAPCLKSNLGPPPAHRLVTVPPELSRRVPQTCLILLHTHHIHAVSLCSCSCSRRHTRYVTTIPNNTSQSPFFSALIPTGTFTLTRTLCSAWIQRSSGATTSFSLLAHTLSRLGLAIGGGERNRSDVMARSAEGCMSTAQSCCCVQTKKGMCKVTAGRWRSVQKWTHLS